MMSNRKLILASKSPRRLELMRMLGADFTVEPSSSDEALPSDVTLDQAAQYLSRAKAEDVLRRHPGEEIAVVGSDTVVISDGIIFGKPADKDEAFKMLRALSGKTHTVDTGVTVLSQNAQGEVSRSGFTSSAMVTFYELTDEEIRAYIETGDPMDKAGAYGIQSGGALLVKGISGDYYTVVGLPAAELYRVLKKMDLISGDRL